MIYKDFLALLRLPYGLPPNFYILKNQSFKRLFCPTVCNEGKKWDTFVLALSCAHLLGSGLRPQFLACRFRVSRDLLGGLMPGDRHDLEFGATKLHQARGGGLAQTMNGAILQPGFITPFAETVADPALLKGRP